MALNKLYYVYGLDTDCLYTDEEMQIEQVLSKARKIKNRFSSKYSHNKKKLTEKHKYKSFKFINDVIKKLKAQLIELFKKNKDLIRSVRPDKILDDNGNPLIKKRVSIFDSALTRYCGLKEREFNTEIVIIQVYFFEIAESIVKNGFYMNGNKYKFFSASAGQIRTKKLVAVREDLVNKHWNSLTAGLSIDRINAHGGMCINKYIAYLALCNSATDLWEDFDIDRCIVVDDFENTILGTVDFIDDKTYDIKRITERLEFTQTDGCGMILPSLTDRNFMVRLPWIKGLLAKFDFVKFIKDNNATEVVTDIYGDEHNIIEENIQIIFTKSQLKMWKFYKSWNEYKDNFKKYNCTAGICNREEDDIPDSVINYQMIQTLSDMTDEELKSLAQKNIETINDLATNPKTMLKVFGADEENLHKNGFQKCLEIYPELLSDPYSKKTLKEIKAKKEKDLWSARFDLGGKFTFVIPDLYAFCEYLFLNIKDPKGLLNKNEVCCKMYQNGEKLDCLRSPHLYLEHPIRVNNTNNEWFDTDAVYISCQDLISRIVQCDFDGDRLLVTNNATLVNAAERNMQDIVPLFYNMRKAEPELITPNSLYNGLRLAYTGGNIGSPSNDITKIWNKSLEDGVDIEKYNQNKMMAVKWLVAEVNYTIDYAKTLYKPKRPKYANEIIKPLVKGKVPYFFRYAKKKKWSNNSKESQVEPIGNSIVDRLTILFPKKHLNYNFKSNNIGKFDYKVLMSNPETEFISDIAEFYRKITKNMKFKHSNNKKMNNYYAVFEDINKQLFDLPYPRDVIIDNIIIELFHNTKSISKKTFWVLFGDDVYKNVSKNISTNFVQCKRCKKRFFQKHKNEKYCDKCRGYQKKKTKTLVCVDCGKEFKVNSNSRSIRCDECKRKNQLNMQKQSMKKLRYKNVK